MIRLLLSGLSSPHPPSSRHWSAHSLVHSLTCSVFIHSLPHSFFHSSIYSLTPPSLAHSLAHSHFLNSDQMQGSFWPPLESSRRYLHLWIRNLARRVELTRACSAKVRKQENQPQWEPKVAMSLPTPSAVGLKVPGACQPGRRAGGGGWVGPCVWQGRGERWLAAVLRTCRHCFIFLLTGSHSHVSLD